MFSEVLQDSTFDLIDAGKLSFASASSVTVSKDAMTECLEILENTEKICFKTSKYLQYTGTDQKIGCNCHQYGY
jgi:acetyl-CoA hydrolase/succinyl-CoA:acetate CoA-transferase